MRQRGLAPLFLVVALAACEQTAQELPFSVDEQVTEKTVAAGGGTISTAAGASVQFPAGSVGEATAVTLTPVAAPASVQQSGTSASGGFQLEPAGKVLEQAASVELRFDASADASNAWLASVVNVLPGSVQEIGNTRVDLSTGVVGSKISQLGTVSVVIPGPGAVFHVQRTGTAAGLFASRAAFALAASGTDSVAVHCGGPENRCTGLTVEASQNLLDKVEDAAVVYPHIDGALRVNGSTVGGSLSLSASFRAVLQSGQTAENLALNAVIAPTAATRVVETSTAITFTHMSHRVTGSSDVGSLDEEEVMSLVIPKSADAGSVAISRSFDFEDEDGSVEEAELTVTFPVQIHQ